MPAPAHVGLNALFLEPGRSAGPETYLRGLVPALAERLPDTRFTVVTTRKGASALRADGWTAFATLLAMPTDEGERLGRLGSEQLRLPWRARRRGWDLLHSLASVAPGRTPGVASVVTLHDVTFFRMRTFGRLTTFAMRRTVAPAARRAHALISGSAAARDDACEELGLDPGRFVVVPHGAGRPPAVRPLAADEVRARHRLGPGTRVVLCVASLRPHKNQALLIRALRHLPADVTLVLAGHPEAYALEVEALARAEGVEERVRLTGYVSDAELEGLWSLAACAALPTLAEGFGLPVLEALQRGVPVACSDIPVLREVGGGLPHAFDPHRPEAAARAIERALEDDHVASLGPAHAARYTWAAAADGTAVAYEKALSIAAAR